MEYKQAIVVRTDLKMSKGKTAAQVAHASIETTLKTDRRTVDKWRAEGAKKVVLKVKTNKELIALKAKAERIGIKTTLISDAGLTEIPAGSVTSLGIGPANARNLDKITGNLKSL